MATKNDENFIAFCNELRVYVEEHHHGLSKDHGNSGMRDLGVSGFLDLGF